MFQQSATANYQNSGTYAANGSVGGGREHLIMSHLPKVKYIADRIASRLPPTVERDDLYSAGVVGLIDAVERYDTSRGVEFTTFAELRVRGAILDNLRSLDWASRSTRRRIREVQNAYSVIEQRNGRVAEPEEVAAEMNIKLSELYEIQQDMQGLTVTNLDEPDKNTGLTAADLVADKNELPFQNLENDERRRQLAKAVEKLPERERQVIALYYLEELTMKEIGEVLGVSESRVSQMRSQAVIRLRTNLLK